MNSNILKDDMFMEDKLDDNSHFWTKTEVIFGTGLHKNEFGFSELEEVFHVDTNMVPIGGVQYAMEQIFGVQGSIPTPTMNDLYGIGAVASTVAPSGGMPYPYGHKVCLFGIGTGGSGENNTSVLEVKYNEYDIADMIPFRYTNEVLSDTDALKYYGKKTVDDTVAYYLKRFDVDPIIRHLYKNGEEGEDGSEVDSLIYSSTLETGVESFAETCLTITKKDVREWFKHNGNIEEARVNSIGLFSAVYDEEQQDYANIQLFSKLNIPTEPLSMVKDLNIIYRVYGS